jgi:hypothetical protein
MISEDNVKPKEPWESPKLTYVGRVRDVVQIGGGKLSQTGGDPGEPRKQMDGTGE